MKKVRIITTFFCLISLTGYSQISFTKTGKVEFDATAASSPERIEATTHAATAVLDTRNGQLQFSILIKSFAFERALMEEHFNENYMESDKYPKAEFKGNVLNMAATDFAKDGTYQVKVKGKLTLHGESRDIETEGKLQVRGSSIQATASFQITLADYKISIPGLVADKVAKTARISIDCKLEPLK